MRILEGARALAAAQWRISRLEIPAAHSWNELREKGRGTGSLTAALKAGLELKHRDAKAQVKVYDAKDRAPARATARAPSVPQRAC